MAEPLSGLNAGHNGGSPVGDATAAIVFDYLDRYEEADERVKVANKARKELRTEIEKTGIPLEAWDSFRRDREKPGHLRQRIDAARAQLMEWDLKPVGYQGQMEFKAEVADLKRVDGEGFDAGKTGIKREANPFTPGTEIFVRWDTAWLRGYAENPAATQGDGGENGEVRRRRGRPPGSKNKPKDATGPGSEAVN
jgi:hypothetical protein